MRDEAARVLLQLIPGDSITTVEGVTFKALQLMRCAPEGDRVVTGILPPDWRAEHRAKGRR